MKKAHIKVFISFSTNVASGDRRNEGFKWAHKFKQQVCLLSTYSEDEVYFYPDAPLGAELREEITQAVEEAEHMICLISDEYLDSEWCCDEYWRYWRRAKVDRSDPIFVITPFLKQLSYGRRDRLTARVRRGIKNMKKKSLKSSDPLYIDDLETFANTKWEEEIVSGCHSKRHIVLYREDDWKDATDRFPNLLAPPRSHFLLDYAGLSTYCLGADRYLSGGWGFSLRNTFLYDREDGEELPNGAYGLNVVILRVLSKFLSDSDFEEEQSTIFPLKPAKRNPVQAVSDRLPHFAALLSCLENLQATRVFLSTHAKSTHELLSGFEPQSRWTLADISSVSRSEEYYASVFVCLDLAQRLENGGARRVLENEGWYDDKLDFSGFSKHCKTAIAQNDVLQMLSNDFRTQEAQAQAFRSCMIWLLLAGCPRGQDLLAAHISDTLEDRKLSTTLLESMRAGLKQADVGSLTISLTICACILGCTGRIEDFSTKVLDSLYELLFKCTESYEIVPKLNAVAWAAIIIIAIKEADAIIECKDLARLWNDGLRLRKERLEDVKQLSQSKDKGKLSRTNLDAWKTSFLQKQVEKWTDEVPTLCFRVPRPSEKQLGYFSGALAEATFWGEGAGAAKGAPQGDSVLGGVLRVNCISDRVEMDSPGYNRIFLRPFSQITGMNVVDLNGIQREFGGLDKELVKIMGETVVKAVYVRGAKEYERDKRGFMERTSQITEQLKNGWRPEEGMDDILIVRREGDKQDASPRMIHRSAIVQRPRKEGADPVISWRFLEMPSWVRSIMELQDETA